jgi:hypothetical protein
MTFEKFKEDKGLEEIIEDIIRILWKDCKQRQLIKSMWKSIKKHHNRVLCSNQIKQCLNDFDKCNLFCH